MRSAAHRAGYSELETPYVESFELYQTKSGEGIAAETWLFHDKGDRPVALVPETTPSLARVFAERAKSEPLPVKWFTVSKTWRYEEPQAGRTREFLQFNLDLIGVPGVEAEADLLSTAALVLDEVGAEDLYAFRINDRAIAEGIGRLFGAGESARFFRAIDRFHKIPPAEFEGELAAVGVGADSAKELTEMFQSAGSGVLPAQLDSYLDGMVRRGLDLSAREGVARVKALFALLDRAGLGDRVVFDPTVVRGLAYYTSTVFEAYARSDGGRAIFGGGRYRPSHGAVRGPPDPGGRARHRGPNPRAPPQRGRPMAGRRASARHVRGRGRRPPRAGGDRTRPGAAARRVSADCDLLARSMSRQLKEAARRRSRRALILGLKEASPGAVVERDLGSGAQREIPRLEVVRSA